MVQILIIALAVGVFMHDAALGYWTQPPEPWLVAAVVFGPAVLLGAWAWWVCRRAQRKMSGRSVRRAERWLGIYRGALLPWYAAQLAAGALRLVRQQLGDFILLDELIVMAPTLALLAWSWWCYYPIDRRLRESAMIGRLDRGLAVYPVWTRGQFMAAQLRHQVLLLLLPLAAVLAWVETANMVLLPQLAADSAAAQTGVVFAGAAVIFLLSPLMIRFVFDTVPLPPGEVRDRLTHLCEAHGVKVRQLLLWRTFGGMINAAVMGVVAPLRYVMLTDALLESFPRDQVEAVMAHELAHVRKRHMFWLIAFAFVVAASGDALLAALFGETITLNIWLVTAVTLVGLAWIGVFGWASRRVERQADAFAAAHLAGDKGLSAIDADSAEIMAQALQRVADLNHIRPEQRSWRHGSILSRQRALRRLVGQPVARHPADRAVGHIKLLTLAIAAALAAYHLLPGL